MRWNILLIILFISPFIISCEKEETNSTPPTIEFQDGDFTQPNDYIPIGGNLKFRITATKGSAPLTNYRVQRITEKDTITEIELGMYIEKTEYTHTITAVKSSEEEEEWVFMVMNANRDTAYITRTVYLGEGTSYGPIKHFSSIKIGMQDNSEYPHFLDLNTGETYNNETITGNESTVDLLGFVYLTGGIMSPTLSCPNYSSVTEHYPSIADWPDKKSTMYDYNAVDNDLVDPDEFEAATNDSLLINSYSPQSVSGNCKYCFTGKIVPFKTHEGKYGLIRIIHANETSEGYMEVDVKIQE
ncbi:MAG: hypothetical protein ACLFNU_08550 [Bacteroidales bacterium]